MSRYTPAQNRAAQKYVARVMEEVKIKWPRADRLNARIAAAADLRGIARRQYIAEAITARLEADGVTIDSLPPDDGPPND